MRWPPRQRSVGNHRVPLFESALFVVFMFLLASPVANDSPNVVALRAKRAQEFVEQLRGVIAITEPIQITVVAYHPLVFSVQPIDIRKDRFLLSMELGFFLTLKDNELRAALAPYLEVGTRVSGRTSGSSRGGRGRGGAGVERDQNKAIRAWAIRKGLPVAPRGRIKQDIVDQYQREAGR